jgi:hypothetical protein
MWTGRVFESDLPFGTKAVLILLAHFWDSFGRPMYQTKAELVSLMQAKSPDLKASYIDKALKAGLDRGLIVREYASTDGYTTALFRPSWGARPSGAERLSGDVYVGDGTTEAVVRALEVIEERAVEAA